MIIDSKGKLLENKHNRYLILQLHAGAAGVWHMFSDPQAGQL